MRTICVASIVMVLALAALIAYLHQGVPGEGAGISGHSLQDFRNTTIINPIKLDGDPYLAGNVRVTEPPMDHTIQTAVCGIKYVNAEKRKYEIKTCRDEADAALYGYTVTHRGYCGTCSTLSDLAVYLRRRDLTYAVRACSFRVARGPILSCLEKIGFTRPCALTWYYNIRNTARHCLITCVTSWMRQEPLNRSDGSLNPCLQCDEDLSGPIFKYYAGRTRRNSGIRSEIRREDGELNPLVHKYQ